jgi:predicted nucleic acid-binding protein
VAVSRGVFFDTSILVAGMVDLGESSRSPLALLDAVADQAVEEPMTAWHCCLEFFSVTTRLPEEYRLSADHALRLLREEVLPRFAVHGLAPERREPFLVSAAAEGAYGGRIYDAHIAEIAHQAAARIVVSDNHRHFASLRRHGVQVLTSGELAARPEVWGRD